MPPVSPNDGNASARERRAAFRAKARRLEYMVAGWHGRERRVPRAWWRWSLMALVLLAIILALLLAWQR